MSEPRQEYWDARKFLLDLSRGKMPMRQCSPYGHLQIDRDTIQERARKAYEYLMNNQQQLNIPDLPKGK